MTEGEWVKDARKKWVKDARKNAVKSGILMFILGWLAVGGWSGYGCYSCVETGSAVAGTLMFMMAGLVSGFLIGGMAAFVAGFWAAYQREQDWNRAGDLYEEICWDEEGIAVGSFIVAILGFLLTIGLIVGFVFAII